MSDFLPFAAWIFLGFAALGLLADHVLPSITKHLGKGDDE